MKKLLLSVLLALSALASEYVLAINWYPSVCKVHHYKTCKKPLPFWQNHLTLHGLWPKKQYCNVPIRWKLLDKRGYWNHIDLKLPPQLQALLLQYMPGSAVGLHNHEWVKHGSCYSHDPQKYFLDAISLVKKINDSPVLSFIHEHRGHRIQTYKIRKIFDGTYFSGAGKRVKFICRKGYLTEIRINLKGRITPKTPLSSLLQRARKTGMGCSRGFIAR
ncbi:hypothetical protein [Nitratiruptor sp. YY09-18]|uniref:ribonuclease T2 family protein n=1 Tax=Nitratiruptor sp. YY09-18 TaxID=2724901 RepID=UPI001916640B|nr:hypothetical protein [Nitratiruptor sp. YY09-18]BCD68650.1 ribonuclease T2 [Nitratiruptor sp. YY09-18]